MYFTNGAVIPTFAMLFISPLLGGIIAGKISKRNKKIVFKDNFNKYFSIITTVIYFCIYVFNFQPNMILFTIYVVGACIGFSSAKKSIEKN